MPELTRLPLGPRFVFSVSMLLTVLTTVMIASSSDARDDEAFENAVQSTVDGIRGRLDAYAAMLRGTSGLFVASDEVTPRDFHDYIARLDPNRNFPGVQGIGFSVHTGPRGRDSIVAAMRAAGRRGFRVYPVYDRPEYNIVVYLEPDDAPNRLALGYDMFTDPTRRVAMTDARDQGVAVMTGKVMLAQRTEPPRQAGFLLFVPVYRSRSIPATVAQRRAELLGFVQCPVRVDDFFRGVFGSERNPRTAFRVYDGTSRSTATLLHDSRLTRPAVRGGGGQFAASRELRVYGRIWTIDVLSLPAFERWHEHLLAPAVAVLGTLVSVLLFWVTRVQMRARELAERSEAVRTRFYAAMSHELRTPVNAILGYNDLLLSHVYGPLATEQQKALERAQRSARHLLELISDVLDLSKLEAGKVTLDFEDVDVARLVEELATTVQPLMAEHGSDLQNACAALGDMVVHTDPRRVRQILLNLLSNAAKFGERKPVEIRCVSRGERGLTIEVVDHGVGIAPDDHQRIFEEFVQLPSAKHGGTGLGLPISRRLATMLGGSLDLTSRLGAGSTFRLHLPRRVATRAGSG